MNICQKDMEEILILSIEKKNLIYVKKILSSGFSVDSILHSRHIIWVINYLKKIFGPKMLIMLLLLKQDTNSFSILGLKNLLIIIT